MNQYGNCGYCGEDLIPADCFVEEERDKYNIPTGRVRWAVGYIVCPRCGQIYTVDDSFDGPWHKKEER